MITVATLSRSLLFPGNRWDEDEEEGEKGTFHIVQDFPLMSHPSWRARYINVSVTSRQARQKEYVDCLTKSLDHPLTRKVHVLTDLEETLKFLTRQGFQNTHKLVFQRIPHQLTYKLAFSYMVSRLPNRLVVFKNADTYPDTGFDLISATYLRSNKLMYVLTRRGRREKSCVMEDKCLKTYIGSHDAYIWVPPPLLPQNALDRLPTKQNSPGVENVCMWVFQRMLGYRLLNPCRIVGLYHNHCSGVRAHGRRINARGMSVDAPYSGLYLPPTHRNRSVRRLISKP